MKRFYHGCLGGSVALGLFLVCVSGEARGFSLLENQNNLLDSFPDNPGELTRLSPDQTVFPVELGLNVARGAFGCFGFGCRDNFDSFRFEVPEGLQVVSTSFLVPNLDGTGEYFFVFDAGVFQAPTVDQTDTSWQTGFEMLLVDTIARGSQGDGEINQFDPVVSSIVLGPGVYDAVPYNHLNIGGGKWEVQMIAEVVPEPAGAILVLGGVWAGCLRRRV